MPSGHWVRRSVRSSAVAQAVKTCSLWRESSRALTRAVRVQPAEAMAQAATGRCGCSRRIVVSVWAARRCQAARWVCVALIGLLLVAVFLAGTVVVDWGSLGEG